MLLSYGSFWALFFAFILPALCANPYYVVIPKSENDQKTNDEVNDDIIKRAGDAGKVFRSSSVNTEIGTLYWWAALSDTDKKDLQGQTDKIRLVEDIGILPYKEIDDKKTSRRRRLSRRKITSQKGPTPYHLKTICQAKDVKLKDIDSYYYDESAGVSTHLYIIDSGMRTTHQEFLRAEISWMFAGPFASQEKNDANANSDGHGTSMASAAIGVQDGSSKRSGLTMVRADTRSTDDQSKLAPLTWLDGIKQVYDDVKKNHKGKAVLSMSWGFSDNIDSDTEAQKNLRNALKDLYVKVLKPLVGDLDTPALISAGNNAQFTPETNTIPAVLAESLVTDLIIVGGVQEDGSHADYYQTAKYVKVYAPADDIETAGSVNDKDYIKIDGTSPATAMTAGIVAYFMTLGKSGSEARAKLYELAYPRVNKGDPVLWNEVDTTKVKGPDPAPQNVDQGILQCKPEHDDGDTQYYFNREGGLAAIDSFCESQGSQGTIMGAGGVGYQEQAVSDGHDTGLAISMDASDDKDCPPTDFTKDGMVDTCKERFGNVVELCDTTKRTSDAWKQGGTFFRDCITWKLVAAGQ